MIVSIFLLIELIRGKFAIVFILFLTLLLLILSDILKKKIKYSDRLQLFIYIFIISTQIFGEIFSFYAKIFFFDTLMHMFSAFIISGLSIYVLKLLNNNSSWKLIISFMVCFSLAMACLWEVFEFTVDRVLNRDMQKDTVITEIDSSLFSENNKDVVNIKVYNTTLNNIDLVYYYGGYIDIGLYDTIYDVLAALGGTLFYILYKKSEAF